LVTSGISRSVGAQSFGGAHRGRVCVRVFIGVSVRACCVSRLPLATHLLPLRLTPTMTSIFQSQNQVCLAYTVFSVSFSPRRLQQPTHFPSTAHVAHLRSTPRRPATATSAPTSYRAGKEEQPHREGGSSVARRTGEELDDNPCLISNLLRSSNHLNWRRHMCREQR
jgi:hypothetical protein